MTTKPITLTSAISEVIENLTMMVVDDPETENFAPQLRGQIEFTGPVNGSLGIQCSENLAQNWRRIYWESNRKPWRHTNAWDALAELLNVVCGNLVTSLYDSERPFNLSSPQINVIVPAQIDDNKEQSYSNDDSQRAFILLDDEPVEFVLSVKK